MCNIVDLCNTMLSIFFNYRHKQKRYYIKVCTDFNKNIKGVYTQKKA